MSPVNRLLLRLISLRDVLRAVSGRYDPRRRLMVIGAYFDESGTHASADVCTVGGFYATHEQWEPFEVLREQLEDAGVSSYHAADLESLRGEFQHLTREEKVRLQKSFVSCLHAVAPHGVVAGITASEFGSNDALRGLVATPYTLCAMRCVLEVVDRAVERGITEPIDFVFDRGGQGKGELLTYMQALACEHPLVQHIFFSDKTTLLPLQAADFIAYEAMKHFQNRVIGGARRPIRRSFDAILDLEPEGWILHRGSYEPLIGELRRLKASMRRDMQ